jgi:hypothetical protein
MRNNTIQFVAIFILYFGISNYSNAQTTCIHEGANQVVVGRTTTAIGQSFKMPIGSCTGYFSSLGIRKDNNDTWTGTLKIFNGESKKNGDKIYEQTGVSISGSGFQNIEISGGVGTVAFVPGNTYTFVLDDIPSMMLWFRSSQNNSSYPNGTKFIAGLGFGGYDLDFKVNVDAQSPLPVELTHFDAKLDNNTTVLTWQTATELNNHGFEIERSQDGKTWENIGFEMGNGTTTDISNYEFVDGLDLTGFENLQGQNLYYRLKQVDFDGQFEYSQVKTVKLKMRNDELRIFPNVVQDQFTIENGEGQATIFNSMGQLVKSFKIQNLSFKIDVADLPQGHYFLQVQSNGQTTTKRFIKQ